MKIKVVTNCTARKSRPPLPGLRGCSLKKGSTTSVAREWKRRLDSAEERVPAGELYQGRAFQEATKAARLAGTPLYVVSAGHGLITEDDPIAPYSLTVAGNHRDAVSKRLIAEVEFSPAGWWKALRSSGVCSKSLTAQVRAANDSLFVLALGPGYLRLLLDDLLTLTPSELRRIRLVGPRREEDVPEKLRGVYMPYDDRLNGVRSPIRGTESDFPQRAAVHFVQTLLSHKAKRSPEAHKDLVRQALSRWPRRKVVVRKKLSERELRREVAAVLRACDDHWSPALRALRDKRIACEQKRFKRMCKEILEARA